ncbi:hypothetical protein SAMD00024442_16_32 [Candidatus Symbiothrix dinenymphae]|nr:hypothetical protein SAMD00024442_16_32 [Candidatus Symbiothrix dinenymphae]
MNAQQLLDEILPLLHSIKDDEGKLATLLRFMQEEFVEEEIEQNDYDFKEKLPEKYRDIVKQMADSLSAGFVCFFNPDTLEMEDIPQSLLREMVFDDDEDEESDEDSPFNLNHDKWDKCTKIEPLESSESFVIMENFVEQLPNGSEKNRLIQALNGRKPFANFNNVIHNSKYRENWFDFRQKELEKHVIQNYFYDYLNDAENENL